MDLKGDESKHLASGSDALRAISEWQIAPGAERALACLSSRRGLSQEAERLWHPTAGAKRAADRGASSSVSFLKLRGGTRLLGFDYCDVSMSGCVCMGLLDSAL